MSEIVKRLREFGAFKFAYENKEGTVFYALDKYDKDPLKVEAADEIERLETANATLTTALENARKDAFSEAREAACEKLKSDLLTVDSMTKIAKKRSWGISPAFLDGVAQGVHQCIATIRSLTPPTEKAT